MIRIFIFISFIFCSRIIGAQTVKVNIDYEDYETGAESYLDKSYIYSQYLDAIQINGFQLSDSDIKPEIIIFYNIGIAYNGKKDVYYGALSKLVVFHSTDVKQIYAPSIYFSEDIFDIQGYIISSIRNHIYQLRFDFKQ